MIPAATNDELTRTDRGTSMGDLFRRYWIPALLGEELADADGDPVRVTILGERLIAFRDTDGRVGLVEEMCAHRGVSLWFGRNEECGLRCPYHGWKYDVFGQCVDLPSDGPDGRMRQRISITAYPTWEGGGVIWAYLGPPPLQPEPPGIEWAHVDPGRRFVSKRLQECNYLQAMEGGIDSSHVSFLHTAALRTDPLFSGAKGNEYTEQDSAPVFEVEEFDAGLLIGARRNAAPDTYYWRITPWIMPWYTIIPPRGDHPLGAHAWVPIDDGQCWAWSINYHPGRDLTASERDAMKSGAGIHVQYVPGTFVPLANRSNDYLIDRAAQRRGETFSGVAGIAMQDASLQESMGPIQDRYREHLAPTDRGIVLARRALLDAAKANRAGEPLPSTDAAAQRVRSCAVVLPRETPFLEGAAHGLRAEPGSSPVSV